MKKLIAILQAAIMVLTLVACSSKTASPAEPIAADVPEATAKASTEASSGEKPTWPAGAVLTVSDYTSDGFTVSWPAADHATSYEISLDGNAAEVVNGTSKTFTNLARKDSGQDYTIFVKAKNGEQVSAARRATANPSFTFESNTLDDYEFLKSPLVGGPDSKYDSYRLPGLVTTNAGTIIAYCEARKGGADQAPMDILAFRSEDQGQTWGEPILLAEGVDIGKTMNNPVMVEDKEGTLHMLYCVECGICTTCGGAVGDADGPAANCTHGNGVFHVTSTDDGKTWGNPVNIAAETFSDEIQHNVIATGPGHAICTSEGVLIASVWLVQQADNAALTSHHPGNVATLYSTDNGQTWQMGEIVPHENVESPNETVAVETSDGGVMLNTRSGSDTYRALAYSPTGYSDWTTLEHREDLIDPMCFGSVAKYDQTDTPYTILMVNCEHTATRANLVVKGSTDDGETWSLRRVIQPSTAGYSDIAVDSQGNIYVFYEVNGGISCRLARFSYAWLMAG